MAKHSLASALTSSLRAAQQAAEDPLSPLSHRAAKADEALQDQGSASFQRTRPPIPVVPAPNDPSGAQDLSTNEEDFENRLEKVVRGNFSMPVGDYKLIASLRERCSRNGLIVSRSEILRAGLHALKGLSVPQLLQVTQSIERLKPGPVKHVKKEQ